jgi:hypothetical protein
MFLVEFKETNNVTQTVAEFNKKLGVSKNVVTSSLNHLVAVGALKRKPFKTEKKGFLNAYEILITAESVTEIFPSSGKNFISPSLNLHRKLVELLYTNERNQARLFKLKLANRLLLSVMLSYADAYGVVRGIGRADLMKLTCMSKDRLQSQLEKLKAEGYIRASVSGVTGRYIFGVAKGLYWLNLKHEHYEDYAYSGDIVSIPKGFIYGTTGLREASDIYGLASKVIDFHKNNNGNMVDVLIQKAVSLNPYLEPCLKDINAIAYFFQDSQSSRVRSFLQLKLDEYACYILSNHWEDISESDDILRDIIRTDLFPDSFVIRSIGNSFSPGELKEKLIEFIYKISQSVAIKLRAQLKLVSGLSFDCSSFTLVSISDKKRHEEIITIEMLYKDKTARISHLYRVKQEDFVKREYSKVVESELSIDEKYTYGLLTRPNEREHRWPVRKVVVN